MSKLKYFVIQTRPSAKIIFSHWKKQEAIKKAVGKYAYVLRATEAEAKKTVEEAKRRDD